MRALVAYKPHDIRIEDNEPAQSPGPGEVRVRIERGGICGSDLHYYHHGGFGAVQLKEPMILGHEVAGYVVETGLAVAKVKVGDRVAINPSMPCGQCRYCRMNMGNQCLDMRFFGSAMRFPHMQGLFREEVTLPEVQVIAVPADLDLGLAACAEPFAVCLHAASSAGSLVGQRVLVSGCGPIGCLMVVAARHAGAQEIVCTDIAFAPLRIATRLGADHAIDLGAEPAGLGPFAEEKGAFDTVFECSGNGKALADVFKVVRPRGTIVAVGLGGDVSMPLNTAVAKEVSLRGSFRFDAEFAWAVELIAKGAVDLSPLVTATLPLDSADEAFRLASDRTQSMKVQIAFH
ncbi:MAG: L-idonate 5-dehydrogenase [Mesorhizobium sp.]|uniref:L-idonate 5-dehydrogenase n=1 Tax=Mesorhizobium sp. TaxID=1871066 RepID=UPI000FEA0D38|nr:L-idonate 5-dehydrogenase [Mesorhizobium sp.]RWM89213.1 MAG: L-idonate 5-dehydrogenase [Mesorhizobium sp.]